MFKFKRKGLQQYLMNFYFQKFKYLFFSNKSHTIAPCMLHKQKIHRKHINKYSAVHQNLPFQITFI